MKTSQGPALCHWRKRLERFCPGATALSPVETAPMPPPTTPEPLAHCAAWLDAYFRKPDTLGTLPRPPLHHPIFQQESFTSRVLRSLQERMPFGEVLSYRQLAGLAGSPRASRAVGNAMRRNPVPILIPCHRVICSSGAVGHYSGGHGVKEWLLAHEGRPAGDTGGPRAAGRDGVCVEESVRQLL
ncbi:methylated-DNA--protein-cysteine methyltransferase isoform X2 [Erinaceus europaeus]|uniref:Methylated-DNA--protein-cysteine methyltransferase n=1 Tax=Erinaceus europaeus TaxID=9365 RepID=A0ABM3VRW8_ERIEU|nr:methylated-DNA--protein-cysteine methyltransferase isoform X2 [Erinaceus europaeus]